MPQHFLGWQNTEDDVARVALRTSQSQLRSRVRVADASNGEVKALGSVTWCDDPLSVRLQCQLAEAGKTLGLCSVTANPGVDKSFGEVAQDFDSSFQVTQSVPYALAVRHPASGVAHQFTRLPQIRNSLAIIVNVGDGANEDPITALAQLTALTIGLQSEFSQYRFMLVGDFALDGLARSAMWLLSKAGAQVTIVGPSAFVPAFFAGIESLPTPPKSSSDCLVLYFPTPPSILRTRLCMSVSDYENIYCDHWQPIRRRSLLIRTIIGTRLASSTTTRAISKPLPWTPTIPSRRCTTARIGRSA